MVLRLQWFITINLQHGKCRIQRFYSFTFTGDEHISTCFDYKTYFSKNLFLTSPPTFMKVKDWIAHVLIRLATQYFLSYGRRYMENNWLCHFFSVCGRRPWVLCVKTNQLQIRTDSSLLYTVLSVYAETDGLQLQQCDIWDREVSVFVYGSSFTTKSPVQLPAWT